jgi:hypothetical protein
MKKLVVLLCTVIVVFGTIRIAGAIPLGLDAGWSGFTWTGGDGAAWNVTFDFTLVTTALLTVTDVSLTGDRFEVMDTGISLGLTSIPTGTMYSDSTDNYDVAAADPRWSTGVFTLGAGTHSISGIAVSSPYGHGSGAVRLDTGSAVPEPSMVLLFGTGLIGLAALGRKKFLKK